jgi:hypothetical protein
MTDRKHLKTRVRARMARTGERYATARSHVAGTADAGPPAPIPSARQGGDAGPLDAATTALSILVASTGRGLPSPLALVIGGGVGIGVFQFHYEREGFASFFLAGRHRWDDDRGYLVDALRRLRLEARVAETGGARLATRHLQDALAERGPALAWVDAAVLGTRGYPDRYAGGAYHLVVVDDVAPDGTATVRDLATTQFRIAGDRFLAARGRIAKDKYRVLWLAPDAAAPDEATVAQALAGGLEATVDRLRAPRNRSFGLAALLDWRDRLRGDGKDAWSRVFPPGGLLLDALTSTATGIRTYGTDGTLHRRTFAAGLRTAAPILRAPDLERVADAYDDLADRWAELADAALPTGVPAFARMAALLEERDRRFRTEGPAALERITETWREADAIRAEVEDCWPLQASDTRALLDELATRLEEVHGRETAALAALDAARPRSD